MLRILAVVVLLHQVSCDFDLLLLHTNDMHSRFQQADKGSTLCDNDTCTGCYGGFARLKSMVELKRAEAAAVGRPTIFLNAGDSYQGTPYYTFFRWPMVARFVNMLGIDVMSLGNHEFDDGVEGLAPYIANMSAPVVCANIDTTLTPALALPNLTPSHVLHVNGTKIGVIGYLTPDTKLLSNPGQLNILDEIPYIRAEAQRLHTQDVNILIALGHSGYDKDLQIAQEVPELDLVVGGHSHTFLYSGPAPDSEVPAGPYPTVVTQSSGKHVPVVQAYYATKYLGYLELTFDDMGTLKSFSGQPILLSDNYSQDGEVLEVLQPYEEDLHRKEKSILGYTRVRLDNGNLRCRLGECNLGNLITDAYVDYVARNVPSSSGWTLAAIGLQQAGNIGDTVDTAANEYNNGSITAMDLINAVLPWDGTTALVNLTGSVLLQALEYSVSRYEDTVTYDVGTFLQLSGLHVEYDLSSTSGNRVESVAVLWADCLVPWYQPLDLDMIYGVVMPQYIAGGGAGFTMLNLPSETVILEKGYWTIVAEYIENHSPIHPVVEGRIIIKDDSSSSAFRPCAAWSAIVFSALAIRTALD